MSRVANFGDPSFEPTDEDLAELMHEAFAEVPARNAAALARIHSEVARLREDALAWLEYLNPDDVARERFGDWNSPQASLDAARWTTARREELLTQNRHHRHAPKRAPVGEDRPAPSVGQ